MRLVTRGDLDGLACAVLVSSCETIDGLELVHPQDVTDRRVTLTSQDILANLPYHPGCGMWFDNHLLTDSRTTPPFGFRGRYATAASAARVVYEHYLPTHPEIARHEALVAETDRLDSGQLTLKDVLSPAGYILLGFTLDPRTGLGAFRDYFRDLLVPVRDTTIEEVLRLPPVQERVRKMQDEDRLYREAALAHSRVDGNVVVTDFRGLRPIPVGNRFLIYTLFPEANVSVRVHWGPQRKMVAVSVGRSVLNRTSRTNVAVLMSLYGGGGHPGAGACQLPPETADAAIAEIVTRLKRNG